MASKPEVSGFLRDAFEIYSSFSAIPHKEIITPDGLVVSDDISVGIYNFDDSFEVMKQKIEQ